MHWVKRVEAILATLKESNIAEIELAEGDLEIQLRRRPTQPIVLQASPLLEASATLPQAAVHPQTTDIKASLTGVYYAAPSPGAPPFVVPGDNVQVGQTIALIEAMKVFNEVQAEVAGRVVTIAVQDGAVVKKGEVLFHLA